MLNLEEKYMIRELHRKGVSISEIARQTGRDRKTVRKALKGTLTSEKQPRRKKATKLGPYEGYLKQRIAEGVLNTRKLLRELKERGYQGGLTQIILYVQPYRTSREERAVMRYETRPGEQAQVDWGSFGYITQNGRQQRLYAFAMVLGYSRMLYVEFTTRMDVSTWLRCHQHAFAYFGGVPEVILHDNLKTAVLSRGAGGKVQWNPRYLDFALAYGFTPQPCKPYRAQTKGKIERSIRYVRQNFWVGSAFVDLEDVNGQMRHWLATVANCRVHGTTGIAPITRMREELLHTLPAHAFDTSVVCYRRAGRDCSVHYRGNVYSVPAAYAQQTLLLKETETGQLCIYSAEQMLIAEHRLVSGRFQRSLVAAHYADLPLTSPRSTPALARQVALPVWLEAPHVETRPLSLYTQLLEENHA